MEYLNYKIYQGKNEIYNWIDFKSNFLDGTNSKSIENDFRNLFENEIQNSKSKKTILNFENIDDFTPSGISPISVLNKLNKEKEFPEIIFYKLKKDLERTLEISQVHWKYKSISNIEEL